MAVVSQVPLVVPPVSEQGEAHSEHNPPQDSVEAEATILSAVRAQAGPASDRPPQPPSAEVEDCSARPNLKLVDCLPHNQARPLRVVCLAQLKIQAPALEEQGRPLAKHPAIQIPLAPARTKSSPVFSVVPPAVDLEERPVLEAVCSVEWETTSRHKAPTRSVASAPRISKVNRPKTKTNQEVFLEDLEPQHRHSHKQAAAYLAQLSLQPVVADFSVPVRQDRARLGLAVQPRTLEEVSLPAPVQRNNNRSQVFSAVLAPLEVRRIRVLAACSAAVPTPHNNKEVAFSEAPPTILVVFSIPRSNKSPAFLVLRRRTLRLRAMVSSGGSQRTACSLLRSRINQLNNNLKPFTLHSWTGILMDNLRSGLGFPKLRRKTRGPLLHLCPPVNA